MKNATFCAALLAVLILGISSAVAQVPKQTPPPKDDKAPKMDEKEMLAKASYLIGRNIVANLKDSGASIDFNSVVKGITDATGDKKSTLTEEEAGQVMKLFQAHVQKIQQQKMAEFQKEWAAKADKNQREGVAFLKKNVTAEGIKQLESGLQMLVVTPTTGAKPMATDLVKVKYRGTLLDGTVFDETKGDDTATFAVNGVIKGFSEGLRNMNVGSKCKLFIPANIAYGMHPRPGGEIGPNATLIFEIELLEIVK